MYHNISADAHISSIERDLMLSYVRQFYEEILETSAVLIPVQPLSKEQPAAVPEFVHAEPTVRIPQPSPAPIIVAEPTPPATVIIEPEETAIFIPKEAPIIPSQMEAPELMTAKVVEIAMETINEEVETIIHFTPKTSIQLEKNSSKPLIKPSHERVESNQLFEEKSGKELSDKLGELPIEDLKKGMSLNERIIFLNELFDGNLNEFENAVHALNIASSFEGAKKLMIVLATRFDWATKEKQAKTFIKLVKRRHSR
ncbi:MAG: hypothetical protein ACOYOA_15165 [Saprospiraceae bacterium]